jgi:Leucine-rich repeat (LRR) protein
MKTILLLMLMLRILVAGIELNCKTSDDPEFQSICKDSNDEIFKFCVNSTVCTFKSEEVGEENAEIEIMVDGNESNYTVIYKSKSVPILPSELYEKLSNLKSCVFYNISTIKIERDWFKYSQSLQELYVLHNAIPTMEGGKFIDLENLQKLNLTSNEIEEIDENAFVGLKKLLIIDLSDNKIKDFHTNLFRDLTYLKELYSDGNPIKTLDEEIFKNLQNLEVLMLIHSDLDYIQRGIFSNNRNLKDLRLRGRISRIDEDAFLGLEKLSYLDISDHLLEIMPPNLFKDLTSLKKLIISNSCNLKYLNVTLFENLRNLEFLQIDSAEFEEVPDGIFRNTINLETLHLQGKISKMSNKIFSHLKKLKGLDLTDNLCASGYNPHHQASIVFMEDALLPCSCKRPRKEDSDVKLKKLLIYSGLVGVIILFIFVCLLRHSQEEENLGKKSSIFRIGEI